MPPRGPRDWAWINSALPAYRRVNRLLPSSGRCKRCWAPFGGPFAFLYKAFLIRPSRKNPYLCTT
ncbi:MAG TPA: hypothetical protein VM070_03980 [Candidatus Saccharimonadales bacterium]|nr:hypothetical protein [Candidatus Saccharimonadales bacterium]